MHTQNEVPKQMFDDSALSVVRDGDGNVVQVKDAKKMLWGRLQGLTRQGEDYLAAHSLVEGQPTAGIADDTLIIERDDDETDELEDGGHDDGAEKATEVHAYGSQITAKGIMHPWAIFTANGEDYTQAGADINNIGWISRVRVPTVCKACDKIFSGEPCCAKPDMRYTDVFTSTPKRDKRAEYPAEAYLNNRWALFTVEGRDYTRDDFQEKKIKTSRVSQVMVPVACASCGKSFSVRLVKEKDGEKAVPQKCCDNFQISYASILYDVKPEAKKAKARKTKAATETGPMLHETVETPVFILPPNPTPDVAEIKKAFDYFFTGTVVEVRAPDTSQRVCSGYYDDFEIAANDAEKLSLREDTCAVYMTIQKINPALLARRKNRVKPWAKTTTGERDVESYQYLVLDFDPKRPTVISSSDVEKAASLNVAKRVQKFLSERGFVCALGDSGNGYHLWTLLESLPINKDNRAVVLGVLKGLAKKFDTYAVEVDTTLDDPAQIIKVYGTVARKGDHTAERPWRTARLLETPELKPASLGQLQKLLLELSSGKTAKEKPAKAGKTEKSAAGVVTADQVQAEFERLGIVTGKPVSSTDSEGNEWAKWHLTCPFNSSHNGKDAYFCLCEEGVAKGAYGYKCSHASCAMNKLAEFQKVIGGFTFSLVADPKKAAKEAAEENRRLILVRGSDTDMLSIKWLWKGRLTLDAPNVLFGEPGLGKGMMAVYTIARMTRGEDFYDAPNPLPPCEVLICCDEDSPGATILPRLRVAGADATKIHFASIVTGPAEDDKKGLLAFDKDMPLLEAVLKEHPAIRAVYVDPLATYMGELDPNKDKDVRPVYTKMTRFCEDHNVLFILVAHPNKQETANAINRLSGAKALASVFRSAWLIENDPDNKDKTKDVRLLLSVKGNLAGRGAKEGLRFEMVNVHDTGLIDNEGKDIVDIGKLIWTGTCDKSADDVLQATAEGGRRYKGEKDLEAAKDFVREYLATGAKITHDLYNAGERAGHPGKRTRSAFAAMDGKWGKILGEWYSALTQESLDAKRAEIGDGFVRGATKPATKTGAPAGD